MSRKTNAELSLKKDDIRYLIHLLDHGVDSICSSGIIKTEESFRIQILLREALDE